MTEDPIAAAARAAVPDYGTIASDLADALRPLLTWAETCSQHYGMLRQEPPFTTTAKLKAALAAAYAAVGQVRASVMTSDCCGPLRWPHETPHP